MFRLFKGGVMGVGAIVSNVIDMQAATNLNPLNIEIVSTGTPTGVYTMESSNQYDAETNPGATFVATAQAPAPAFPIPAGAGAQTMHTFTASASGGGRFVRMRYVGSGGAGVLDAFAFVRGS